LVAASSSPGAFPCAVGWPRSPVPLAAAGTDASSLLHHEMSPLFVAEAKFHTGLGCLLIHHLNGPKILPGAS